MSTQMSAVTLATQINAEYNVYGAMQLQKILYYSEAWAQVLGGSLFVDPIEAWAGGPVVRDVYTTYRYYELGRASEPTAGNRKKLLDAVVPFYIKESGAVLSERTHTEAPWIEAFARGANTLISRDSMRNFYARQALLQPELVPDLPMPELVRQDRAEVEVRAQEISKKWERTLAILGS